MKTILLIIALLFVSSFTLEIPEENDVLVLDDNNFDEAIKANEFILVEFYAPWCGHCKKLAPELEKAAATLKASERNVPIAKVDATTQKSCSAPYNIKGFPTLKFFSNGNVVDYNGGRTAKDVVAWIQKRTGEVSQAINDETELNTFIAANPVAVVYYTSNTTDENWNQFKSVAMNFDKIAFAHCSNEALATQQNSALGRIALYKDFDEKRNDFEGEFTSAAINDWINEKKVPTVMGFDDTAIELVFQKGEPMIFLFHNDTEDSIAARAQFDLAAQNLKQSGNAVRFCFVQPSNQHWQRLADYIGVNTAVVPSVMLVKSNNGDVQKFKFSGEQTAEGFQGFIQEFQDNKLTQHVKSEDIPESNDQPVKIIVGKNFEDEVINNNKDVLVKFYAPWCGHCKSLAPHWDAAAEQLLANQNIVIAKCDSTQNEISSVNVKGFPTLKFYPGNNKSGEPLDYNGERTTEGIISWLKENTTHPWVELGGEQQQEQQQTQEEQTQQQEQKRDDL